MVRQHAVCQNASKPKILLISDIAYAIASMSRLPVFTFRPARPFSNTREIHLLACYKAAHRTRRPLMLNRQCTHQLGLVTRSRLIGSLSGTAGKRGLRKNGGNRLHGLDHGFAVRRPRPWPRSEILNVAPPEAPAFARPRSFQELRVTESWLSGFETNIRGGYRGLHHLVLRS